MLSKRMLTALRCQVMLCTIENLTANGYSSARRLEISLFRLTFCSAASMVSLRCNSGGTRTRIRPE